MKLNPKVYKAIKGEPFMKQNIEGKEIEFYYMEETPFMNEYAGKGRFALWTSDGANYRVLIEKTYYEALGKFYEEPINAIWINFLDKVGKLSTKMRLFYTIPLIIVYIIVAAISTMYFPDQLLLTLIIMVIVVIGFNMVRAQLLNRRAHAENTKAQEQIRNELGEDLFEEMIKAQEEHYKNYFRYDEEDEEVLDETEDINAEGENDETEID